MHAPGAGLQALEAWGNIEKIVECEVFPHLQVMTFMPTLYVVEQIVVESRILTIQPRSPSTPGPIQTHETQIKTPIDHITHEIFSPVPR